jgi:hypothetical protein
VGCCRELLQSLLKSVKVGSGVFVELHKPRPFFHYHSLDFEFMSLEKIFYLSLVRSNWGFWNADTVTKGDCTPKKFQRKLLFFWKVVPELTQNFLDCGKLVSHSVENFCNFCGLLNSQGLDVLFINFVSSIF